MKTLILLPHRLQTALRAPRSAFCIWLATGAACFLLPSANGTPLFQEGFDYTSGSAMAGQGNWVNPAPLIKVGAVSLTYPGLSDTSPPGFEAAVTGQSASSASFTYSPFGTSASSGTVYASFLLDFTVVGGNYTFLGMLPTAGNGGTFTSANDPIDIASKASGSGYVLGIRALGAASATYAAPVLAKSTPELIVLKYDFSSKTASLFINPVLVSEPGTADISSLGTSAAVDLDQFYLRIGGSNQGNYQVDTLRVGTTWADVVPVPEPAALTLIGLAVLGLGLARRMRR